MNAPKSHSRGAFSLAFKLAAVAAALSLIHCAAAAAPLRGSRALAEPASAAPASATAAAQGAQPANDYVHAQRRLQVGVDAVDVHNAARAEVGVAGLAWSDELAAGAQTWATYLCANGCAMVHSGWEGVGENLYIYGSTDSATVLGVTSATASEAWRAEKEHYSYGPFDPAANSNDGSLIGHYTQMVWRDTTEVGCASATGVWADDGSEASGWPAIVWVCQYRQQGNILTYYPY